MTSPHVQLCLENIMCTGIGKEVTLQMACAGTLRVHYHQLYWVGVMGYGVQQYGMLSL